MDVIVYFGGGGALGAFDAGVWAARAPRQRAGGARVAALSGASIGAVNAACLARHADADDYGASELESLWRDELATGSVAFNGALAFAGDREARSWNGVLTGLLVGNRRLYRADATNWNPLSGLARRRQPLMDRRSEWTWLRERLGTLPTAGNGVPFLAVPTVDVLTGDLVLFDNARAPLAVDAIAASSAIPLLFEPVEIDGRLYWDGDMTRESALPPFLERACDRIDGARGETVLVAVDHMSHAAPRAPDAGLEIAHRVLELLLHGKTRLRTEDLEGIDRVVRIEREAMPHDGISGQFDYSPERVDELIRQGADHAARAWDETMRQAPRTSARRHATIDAVRH